MPERTYVGSHDEVEFMVTDGTVLTARKGGPAVKVDEETAKSMDLSDAWADAKSKVTKKESQGG